MILPPISTGGRAAQARLNTEKAAEHPQPQADAEIDLDDSGTAAAAQRIVQISDEMSAALAQFRGRRLFELRSDALTDTFERVLEDDTVPKARQVLNLARLTDKPVAWLLEMARSLFPDDSDLALVLRELLRRRKLETATRQRLETLLQTVVAQGSPKRMNAGINSALKARMFGASMAMRAGLLRETYRDFLESDEGPLDCYQDWIALYGPPQRMSVLAFIEAALLTDISAQDPSCSRAEFGQLLGRLIDLKHLRSADELFIGSLLGDALICRHNPHEPDWLVFLLGLLAYPDELDQLLLGALGERVLLSAHRERSTVLQKVRRLSLQLPTPLFADEEAPLRLAQQFTRLADIAYAHECIEQRRLGGCS
ncbi:type III secretion system gatekeeper subunit SctW [Pseudomonas sp. PCH199]|uniref:type III secretion system gatekeeper subunit SctW n=1 Tax=unclassified Pseudomonas TaxID=196821 RepID=UPI000BD38C1E|nr:MULTISPECIES: type III secretion system gatekeeper subunit SctW [unclassified Pseudomonas]MCW8276870.1 type III secretion system gatekeeper subunit SctW [Pseudomonas sp. PCH199]PAM83150.1 type III secretion regulator InvE [Pseudomonas sp. ERMR1:02]